MPRLGLSSRGRGLVMEACSSYFLPRLIGYGRAMRVCTTGAVMRADSKVYEGLFAETVDGDVLEKALEFADDIVKNVSVVSAYLMLEMMWRGSGWQCRGGSFVGTVKL